MRKHDLTIEYYYRCQSYHRWVSEPLAIQDMDECNNQCMWDEFLDDEAPVRTDKWLLCPRCHGHVVSVPHAT